MHLISIFTSSSSISLSYYYSIQSQVSEFRTTITQQGTVRDIAWRCHCVWPSRVLAQDSPKQSWWSVPASSTRVGRLFILVSGSTMVIADRYALDIIIINIIIINKNSSSNGSFLEGLQVRRQQQQQQQLLLLQILLRDDAFHHPTDRKMQNSCLRLLSLGGCHILLFP